MQKSPPNLAHQLVETIPSKLLRQAAEEISNRYRLQQKPYLTRYEHYVAYLGTRFPATYAAVLQVLKQVSGFEINTMLDLGAGPGTGFLAAQQYFSHLSEVTLLEGDPQFIALGKKMIDKPVTWQQAVLPCALRPHDLVLMSYSLNEIIDQKTVIEQAWQAAGKLLVIIEPGTPQGYERVIRARELLIQQNAHIIAPCPNALPCPMQGSNWCHFPARVQRSKMHKHLKSGDLGYEDEKFSYLIVGKETVKVPSARIVARPEFHTGWVEFTVCTQGLIEKKILSQKAKELYKKSRKLSWGDGMNLP